MAYTIYKEVVIQLFLRIGSFQAKILNFIIYDNWCHDPIF